ncbi:MAG: hypothetical protein RL497_3090 [Pseudomonadota bacterium]|jgi:hypothetical protein
MTTENEREKQARENAQKAANTLFGKRTKEQEEALKKVTSVGSPDNLIKPDGEDE